MKPEISFSEIIARMKDQDFPAFGLVVGIASGGIAPAAMLAYQLDCDLRIIHLNYRDDANQPRYGEPKLLSEFTLPEVRGPILLVDDVSVSGATLACARSFIKQGRVRTLVLRGKADYVLFPEIEACVSWPWKI